MHQGTFSTGIDFVLRLITYYTLQWLQLISANHIITFEPYLLLIAGFGKGRKIGTQIIP
jgi:hypothetical protein